MADKTPGPDSSNLTQQTLRLAEQARRLHAVGDKLRTSADRHASGLSFLNVELDTGNVFAGIALSTNNSRKRSRNYERARQALESFRKHRSVVDLAPAELKEITAKLKELEGRLRELASRSGNAAEQKPER